MKLCRITALALLLSGMAVPFAAADPIIVTSGSAVIGNPFDAGSISIAGTEGFSFTGHFGGANFSCIFPPCSPATALRINCL